MNHRCNIELYPDDFPDMLEGTNHATAFARDIGPMNPREFFINPADYGLPTRDELVAYRIWDNHFHGFAARNPIEQYERNNFFVERMGIERSIAQEVGGTLEEPFAPYQYDSEILKILERDKDRLSGRTPIDPGFSDESCAKIEKWSRHGPF